MAVIVAIWPSWLTDAGGTAATPGVSATARRSAPSCRSVSEAPFGMSTASRNGPFDPGPNASVSWSKATRCVVDVDEVPVGLEGERG
jgi:hypothetical protein